MTTQRDTNVQNTPNQLFDDKTFGTLYGGTVATWVATSALVEVGLSDNVKLLGLIMAMIVAFVGYFVSDQKSLKKLVIAPFNGFLIFLTILGGTSFFSSSIESEFTHPDSSGEPTEEPAKPDLSTHSAFFMDWNPDTKLLREANELVTQKNKLLVENQQLEMKTLAYKEKLETSQQIITNMELPLEVRRDLEDKLNPNLSNFDRMDIRRQ